MKPNYEKLRHDLCEYGDDAALNLLYEQYQELELPDRRGILDDLVPLNDILEKLPLQDNDEVFNLTVRLCEEHEKRGFFSGIRIGAKLMQELNGKCGKEETDCHTSVRAGSQ